MADKKSVSPVASVDDFVGQAPPRSSRIKASFASEDVPASTSNVAQADVAAAEMETKGIEETHVEETTSNVAEAKETQEPKETTADAPFVSRPPEPMQSYNNGFDRPRYNNSPVTPMPMQTGGYSRVMTPTPANTPTEEVKGYLDVQHEGHGFLRPKFIPSSRDIYISQSQIRRFMLRPGDLVEGVARPPKDTERYYGLLKVEKVNGVSADDSLKRPHFDDLTPVYPNKQIVLSTGKTPVSTRIIDLISPIGFGQRGMIVSPPKAGKTTIIKEIAAGITANFPDVHLMACLVGERPEEVTDISMSVKGEVVASNFDEPPENQTRVAEITLERAKRLVEMGKDVIILLDSITRLARAYNLSVAPSGRTLSGGFDPAALYPAKKFFGAARNCQEGGSLTVIGTALTETGSRLDDLVYEEFKGTGNMEMHLDRRLAERRIYPAINIERSGTRQEELLLSEANYKKIVTMRRMMDMLGADERTSLLIEKLSQAETNEDFLENLGKS